MNYQEKAPDVQYPSVSLPGNFPAKIQRYPVRLSVTVASLLLALACLSHGVANAQVTTVAPPVTVLPVTVLPPVTVMPPMTVSPGVTPLPAGIFQPTSVAVAGGRGGGGHPAGGPAAVYVTVMCAFAQDGSDECRRGVA